MLTEVNQLRKKALALVKSAKHEYYMKLTEEADLHNMWNFWKWTNGKHVYTSPALSRGDREVPAVTHSNKCTLLRSTLFPTQPQLSDELSQLATGCVTCHTSHSCMTHFRPILGNLVEVTLVTSPFMYIVSHTKGTSFP